MVERLLHTQEVAGSNPASRKHLSKAIDLRSVLDTGNVLIRVPETIKESPIQRLVVIAETTSVGTEFAEIGAAAARLFCLAFSRFAAYQRRERTRALALRRATHADEVYTAIQYRNATKWVYRRSVAITDWYKE